MADLKKDITAIKNPDNIKNSGLASSPYVLRKVFTTDPIIQRLIRAGDKVIPLINAEMRSSRNLKDITLAAFAYIIEKVQVQEAPQILKTYYPRAVEKPGPFFVHFATHAIRSGLKMPVKPLEIVYSRVEMNETQSRLR